MLYMVQQYSQEWIHHCWWVDCDVIDGQTEQATHLLTDTLVTLPLPHMVQS